MGVIFGFTAVAGMLVPVRFGDGVFLDPRAVVLSLAGASGGPAAALIAGSLVGLYRLFMGGAGVLPGLLSTALSAGAGLLAYRRFQTPRVLLGLWEYAWLGLAITLCQYVSILALPSRLWESQFRNGWLGVLFSDFFGVAAIGVLLQYQARRDKRSAEAIRLSGRLGQEVKARTRELEASEHALRVMLDHLPDGVFLYNEKGTIVEVNSTFLRLFELGSKDQAVGKTPLDFSDLETMTESERASLARAVDSETLTFEWHCQVPHSLRRFSAEVKLGRVDWKGESHFMAVARDLTAQKAIEQEISNYHNRLERTVEARSQELAKVSERLTLATQAGKIGVWEWDRKADQVIWNETMGDLYGLSPGTARPATLEEWAQKVTPEDRSRFVVTFEDVVKHQQNVQTQFQIRTGAGVLKTIRSVGKLVEQNTNKAQVIVGVSFDVTEAQQMQAALVRERETARMYLDIVEAGIVLLDTQGRIELLNRKGHLVLSEISSVLGENWYDTYLSEATREKERARFFDLMAGRIPPAQYHETEIQVATGEIRNILSYSVILRDEEGCITGLLSSFADITEDRRQTEQISIYSEHLEELVGLRTNELLTARDEANAANQAKTLFLANMSHEIRTPLNAVMGYAQLLAKDVTLTSAALEKVNMIFSSAEHLLAMLTDILEMSRVEAGKFELHDEPTDAALLVNEVFSFWQSKSERLGPVWTLENSVSRRSSYILDGARFRQILHNLCSNAQKYAPRGQVIVRARWDPPSALVVEVEDQGPGISEQDAQKLFRPFERAESARAMASGTGLGLAISRRFAELMGGGIELESAPQKGSIFRVRVTAVPSKTKQLSPRQAMDNSKLQRLAQPGVPILVADDILANRYLLREWLSPWGFLVLEAETGREAIELALAARPPLILMDLKMPDVDGAEAAREIKAKRGDQVTIIGVSADVFPEQQKTFLAAGLAAFLARPFREDQLFAVLKEYSGLEWTQANESPLEVPTTQPLDLSQDFRTAWTEALDSGNVSALRTLADKLEDQPSTLALKNALRQFDLESVRQEWDTLTDALIAEQGE